MRLKTSTLKALLIGKSAIERDNGIPGGLREVGCLKRGFGLGVCML